MISNLEELERARQLYIRYARIVDNGEHEELLSLFTPDGVFESSWLGRFEGHEGMRELRGEPFTRHPRFPDAARVC